VIGGSAVVLVFSPKGTAGKKKASEGEKKGSMRRESNEDSDEMLPAGKDGTDEDAASEWTSTESATESSTKSSNESSNTGSGADPDDENDAISP